MFGQLGKLPGILKQVGEVQAKMKEIQENALNMRFDADSGAGAVTATVNGKMELVALKITPATVQGGDVEMLEDLVKSAVAAAQRKAQEGMKQEMAKITGGLNLPNLEGLLGG